MTHDEVYRRLQSIFDELFLTRVELTPSLAAKDVAEWDSLMQINIVIAVEAAFGVRFRVGEVEKTRTVGEFVDLIIARKGA